MYRPEPLFSSGDNVAILPLNINGVINKISYSVMDGIEYKVAYNNNGVYLNEWFQEYEISRISDELKLQTID